MAKARDNDNLPQAIGTALRNTPFKLAGQRVVGGGVVEFTLQQKGRSFKVTSNSSGQISRSALLKAAPQ